MQPNLRLVYLVLLQNEKLYKVYTFDFSNIKRLDKIRILSK